MNTTDHIPKPMTLIREDYVKELIELTNNTQLPFFVIENVLKDLLNEIHMLSQKQLESDRMNYISRIENQDNNQSNENFDNNEEERK